MFTCEAPASSYVFSVSIACCGVPRTAPPAGGDGHLDTPVRGVV
jgi:hypothetical protein